MNVNQRIEELTRRFLSTLPQRVSSIDDSRVQLSSRLHALAGTAATYGVHDVARLAREAETVCASLDELIDGMRRAVEAA